MITRNDYDLQLFNGDVGVVMRAEDGSLRAYFEILGPAGESATRSLPVGLLSAWETAFATTVHKAQGSEFENLLIVLPPRQIGLLSQELLYTALTRVKPDPERPAASGQIHLWCTAEGFRLAARERTSRASGLDAALRGAGGSG